VHNYGVGCVWWIDLLPRSVVDIGIHTLSSFAFVKKNVNNNCSPSSLCPGEQTTFFVKGTSCQRYPASATHSFDDEMVSGCVSGSGAVVIALEQHCYGTRRYVELVDFQ